MHTDTAKDSLCVNGEIRLVDGAREGEGRVEICFNSRWGSVCSSGWDRREAEVVCRSLGFNSNTTSMFDSMHKVGHCESNVSTISSATCYMLLSPPSVSSCTPNIQCIYHDCRRNSYREWWIWGIYWFNISD